MLKKSAVQKFLPKQQEYIFKWNVWRSSFWPWAEFGSELLCLKCVTVAVGGGGELFLLIYKSGGNCIIHTHQIKEIAPYKQDLYNSLQLIDPAFIVKVTSRLCMCTCACIYSSVWRFVVQKCELPTCSFALSQSIPQISVHPLRKIKFLFDFSERLEILHARLYN